MRLRQAASLKGIWRTDLEAQVLLAYGTGESKKDKMGKF